MGEKGDGIDRRSGHWGVEVRPTISRVRHVHVGKSFGWCGNIWSRLGRVGVLVRYIIPTKRDAYLRVALSQALH